MTHKAKAVANAILDRAECDGVQLTPMQLLKLIYIAHGWHLATIGKPLIDEPVLAWRYGPVVRSVYREFREYGGKPIAARAIDNSRGWPSIAQLQATKQTELVLDKVWSEYGQYSGPQLMHLTHQPDSPWFEVWHNQGGKDHVNAVIDDDQIKEHFIQKARQQKAGGQLA